MNDVFEVPYWSFFQIKIEKKKSLFNPRLSKILNKKKGFKVHPKFCFLAISSFGILGN
jgi:hypothetical protein